MGDLTALVILLTAIAYLIVRIVLFSNAMRRKEGASSQEKEKPSSS
jgi:hypothetical protein